MTFIYYDPDDDYEYGPDLSDLVEYLQTIRRSKSLKRCSKESIEAPRKVRRA